MTWIINLFTCIHLYISIFGGVRGHSINNRQLLRVEPLQGIKVDIAPRPDKFFQKRNLSPNPTYQPTKPQSIEHDDILRLQFNAFNQSFYLHLEPNLDLFHPSAVTWHAQDQRAEPLTHEQFRVYRGYVVSDTHTHWRWQGDKLGVQRLDHYGDDDGILGWARVVLRQDLTSTLNEPIIEGAFELEQDLYHIKTAENYILAKRSDDASFTQRPAPMAIYRDSDTTLVSSLQGECQFEKLQFNLDHTHQAMRVGHPLGIFDTSSHALFGPVPGLAKRQSTTGCPSSTKIAYMGAAADCTYTRAYRSTESARAQIITDWNTASGIYESTFNIQLGLINITIMSESCPSTTSDVSPWNRDCSASYSISDRLSDFSLWRSYMSDDGAALWHLMTNCPTGTEVGVAWLKQLCNSDVSRQTSGGVTQYVSGTGVSSVLRDEWKVVAHEIGHGFGAIHDCAASDCPCSRSCSCCQLSSTECSAGGTYIMNPTNNVSSNSFSPCSINTICGLYSSLGSCIEDPGSRTVETLQQCGNGIKEKGEDCDPGNTSTACCDAETCKFIGNAVCDDATDGCCDNCQIRPANYTCREATGECDVEEVCNGTSSACPTDTYVTDGTSCGASGDGLRCATGECTSRDLQCRQRGSELSITKACSSMGSRCEVVCQSAQGSGCIVFNGKFLDGTPCGSGGSCSNGSCSYGSTSDRALAWLADNKEIAIPVGCVIGIILLLILARCFFKGCCCCWPGLTVYKTRRRARQQGHVAPSVGTAAPFVPPAAGAVPMRSPHSNQIQQPYYEPPSSPPPPLSRPRSESAPRALQNAPSHWVDPSAYNGPSSPSYPPRVYAPSPTIISPRTQGNSQQQPPPPPPIHGGSGIGSPRE